MKTLLFVTDRNVLTPTGERRLILDRAEILFQHFDIKTEIVVLRPKGRSTFVPELASGLPYATFRNEPYSNLIDFRTRCAALADEAIRRQLAGVVLSGTLIHLSTSMFLRTGLPITIDVHGDLAEWREYPPAFLKGSKALGAIIGTPVKLLSDWALKKAGRALVVSPVLEGQVRASGVEHVYLVPCCVTEWPTIDEWSDHRRQFRALWDIPESATVWMYSGGLSGWQLIDETLKLFANEARRDEESWFVVATPDIDRVKAKLLSLGSSTTRFRLVSLPSDQIVNALCAADIGVMLRRHSATNAAAFPNKFSEYLAANLFIVVGEGALGPAQMTASNELGEVVNPDSLLDASTEVLVDISQRVKETRSRRWKSSREVLERISMRNTLWPFASNLN